MKIKYFLFALILIGATLVSGCGPGEVAYTEDSKETTTEDIDSPPPTQETTVQTLGEIFISAKNWDADAEIDGLEFTLSPRDKNDRLVMAKGVLDAKMWDNEICDTTQESLEIWSLPVSEQNYDGIWGAQIRLEYKNYVLNSDDFQRGCVEIKFVTNDGKEFTAKDDSVYLNGL